MKPMPSPNINGIIHFGEGLNGTEDAGKVKFAPCSIA